MPLSRTPIQMLGVTGGLAMRNRVINGCCRVKQRSSVSLTTSNQFGEVDRMLGSYVNGSAGTFVQEAGSLSAGMSFKRGVKFNGVTLSSGYIVLRHRIEVMNCLDMSGQTVTASVKVLHDFGSSTNFKIGLRKPSSGTADSWGSGSSLTSVSDVNVAVPSASTTVVSGTWTLNSTDADLGLEIVVYCDPVSVTTKNVVIGDIQLTLGSDVEQIERRSYGNELHLCQRYFWPYIFGDSAGQTPGPIGWGETTTTFLAPVQFPQSMRAAPVISTTNAAADFRARYGNASIPCSAVPYGVNTNTMGCWLFGTVASGITVNGIYALSGNASNVKLNFSAEL